MSTGTTPLETCLCSVGKQPLHILGAISVSKVLYCFPYKRRTIRCPHRVPGAYSTGEEIKWVCVCACVCASVLVSSYTTGLV